MNKQSLLQTYRDKYPHLNDVDDNALYTSLIQKFPHYKNQLEDYNTEYGKSLWDSMPNMIKSGYNKSLQGMAQEIATGRKRFDLSGYEPGVIEDLGSEILSFFMPADFALTLATGGVGAALGKKTLSKTIFNKLRRNGIRSDMARRVASNSVANFSRQAASSVGGGTLMLGSYQGAANALQQKLETGEIKPGEVVKEFGKGAVLGGVTAGTGSYLTARGASKLSRLGAEIGTFGTGAPLMEGEIPTPQDYLHTAGMILGIKGVNQFLKTPKKLKQIREQGTLFELKPEYKMEIPGEKLGMDYAKASVDVADRRRIAKERWIRKSDKGGEVYIMPQANMDTAKTYKVYDKKNKKSYSIKKEKFHNEFELSDKSLMGDSITTMNYDRIRKLEKELGLDEASAQIRRKGITGEVSHDVILGSDGLPLQNRKVSLTEMNSADLNSYRNTLLKEKQLQIYKADMRRNGWDTQDVFKHTFLEEWVPKPFKGLAAGVMPAEMRGTQDPARRKYVRDLAKYQDKSVALTGEYMTDIYALNNGTLKPPKSELKEWLDRGLSRKEAENAYWERMTELKKAGKLPEWNKFTDKMFNHARESGIEIPGYYENYVPQIMKREIADIVFNDLLTIRERESGLIKQQMKAHNLKEKQSANSSIDDLLSTFNNVDDFIKNNPEQARFMNELIEKSLRKLNPQTRQIIEANRKQGDFSALKAYSLVGKTIYNDIFSTFGNLEMKRTAKMPVEFLERNLALLMSQYASRASRRIAQVDMFGLKGEKFDALIRSVEGRSPQDASIMRELHHHATGLIEFSDKFNYSPRVKELWKKVMEWETGTKIGLGFATIPNVTQSMISSAMDAGYWRFFRGLASLRKKEVRQMIRESGATSYSQLAEMLGMNETTALTSGIVDGLAKYTGFKGINKMNQIMAAATAKVFVDDLLKMSTKGMTRSRRKWAKSKLGELGVDWKVGELNYKNPSDLKVIKSAMERFARNTQLQRDILKDPLIFNNPRTKMFTQFKRFGYRQAQYTKDVLRHDIAHGNILPLLRLGIGGYAGGQFVHVAKKIAREWISGEDYYDPSSEKTWPKDLTDLVDNLAAVGGLGLVGDVWAAALEEGGSLTRAIKFITFPPIASDIENLFDRFLSPMENDFKNLQGDALKRAPSRLMKFIGGSTLRELSKRIEPRGMTLERLTAQRSRAVSNILDQLEKASEPEDYDRALANVRLWNEAHPMVPISSESVSARAIVQRKMRRYKKKVLG